jgi:hypothetical protein
MMITWLQDSINERDIRIHPMDQGTFAMQWYWSNAQRLSDS